MSLGELGALDVAGQELQRRLAEVPLDQLERPSSCAGWSVYDLINHVIGGAHRYRLLMHGAQAEQLAPTRSQDHVRPDPVLSYFRWEEPLRTAFHETGALERVVHHRAGDRSGLDLLRMRTLELTLHAWDLARSLDLDETLDEQLADYLLANCMYLVDELREHGMYAPARGGDDDGSPRAQLLRRTGRG
jgi:uncharacterized protein (TIGR03086 family)